MLKVRLMGTKNDIKWFQRLLQRNPKVEVTEFSDLYERVKDVIFSIVGSRVTREEFERILIDF